MSKARNWLVIFIVAAACTCGARTECSNGPSKISLLTGIHDDSSCRQISERGVLLYEASQLIVDQYNSKTTGFKIEIAVLDTCGSITGALKAAMKALVSADVGCLQPPHYLGIIGPDNPTNVEAVQKVTSVLRVPHLVRKPSTSVFLHHLAMENNSYIVQGILKLIERLKWKTFTLVAPVNDEGNDDVQNIAKKLTIEAIARNLCVIVYDNEEGDFTRNVIHIGKPEDNFFSGPVNSTVLIVSQGLLENQLNRINTPNMILLLEDDRNDLSGLQARVEKSKWWNTNKAGKFDPEELREVRWLQDAIESYGTALDSICKKKKCKTPVDAADWNEMISKVSSSRNVQNANETRGLNIFSKSKYRTGVENLGKIIVKNNIAKISWNTGIQETQKTTTTTTKKKKEGGGSRQKASIKEIEDEDEDTDDDDENNDNDKKTEVEAVPRTIAKIVAKSKIEEIATGCVADLHEAKLTKDEEEHATHIVVSEMDDSEWWTMVGTVSGVGVAMFVVGILAVYIVYTNIRGPRSPKGQSSTSRRYSVDNDTSLHRVGSDRGSPAVGNVGRNQRQQQRQQHNSAHRRDSLRSNISDRSV